MARDPQERTSGPEARRRIRGGCTPVSGILLFAILAVLVTLVWLRSHHDVPNPTLSGHPPTLPAH
jgi:hypothetical protein